MGSLIRLGDFTLHSGTKSDFKLDCDAFIEENLEGLAFLIRRLVGPYDSVEGVPRGGLRLAEALRPHAGPPRMGTTGYPHLIVDDVMTTGRSMSRMKDSWPARDTWRGDETEIVGAVVFARGPRPYWIQALFQLPKELWP